MPTSIFTLFSIKDLIDILLVATLLYYLYRTMKNSGSLDIFVGVLAFVVAWVVMYKILDMRLIGTFMDKFIDIGLFILVILFQDEIKRFLTELGSRRGLKIFEKLFKSKSEIEDEKKWILPVVYACMNMSKTKTGALIVIQQTIPLTDYERTGDMIKADINSRLIENIFFKNSPLHDGALIIAGSKIMSAGCILPVSHDLNILKELGLRHRAALGITHESDCLAIVVSEETGGISVAIRSKFQLRLTAEKLESLLTKELA
jgi:uncharacterized protein (TIGR00159 family)